MTPKKPAGRARSFFQRDQRIQSQPGDRNYVRYESLGEVSNSEGNKPDSTAAQFSDVSLTGMRLISRAPAKTQIGDYMDVQFSLPGSKVQVKARAKVVRLISDFEFAVVFADFKETQRRALQTAIHDYIRYLRTASISKFIRGGMTWGAQHRQGLMIALVGALIFGGAFSWIYFHSDQYEGKQLRPWGAQHPKQWDLDYYNRLPANK